MITELKFADLTFEAKAIKDKLLLLEPIPIHLRVTNNQASDIIGEVALDNDKYCYMEVIFNGVKKIVKEFAAAQVDDCIFSDKPQLIKPGQVAEDKRTIFYKLAEIFPATGIYQLQFILRNRNLRRKEPELYSNILTIEIIEPVGLEYQAYQTIINTIELQHLMQHGPPLTEKPQVTEPLAVAFLDKFPDSAYAKSIKQPICRYYQFLTMTKQITEAQKANYEKWRVEVDNR